MNKNDLKKFYDAGQAMGLSMGDVNKIGDRIVKVNKDIREFNENNKGKEIPEIDTEPNKVSDLDSFCESFGVKKVI